MGSVLLLRHVRQGRKIAMVFEYQRVRHVVQTDRSVALVFLFALREILVALPARRYFALMMMHVSLAFQTVLVPRVVIQ